MSDTPTTRVNDPHDGVTVTFALNLDTIVGESYCQVSEDDYAHAPVTLGDAVIERTARMLLDRIVGRSAGDDNRAAYRTVVDHARQIIEARVAAAVDPVIDDMLRNGTVQRTDSYGAPQGPPVAIRDLVIEHATAACTRTTQAGHGRRSGSTTVLDQAVEDVTTRVLTKEFADAVADAKAAVVGELQSNTAEVLAAAIAKGVTR
jgi:hypothetical protein